MGTHVTPCNDHSRMILDSAEAITKGIGLFTRWELLLDTAYAINNES